MFFVYLLKTNLHISLNYISVIYYQKQFLDARVTGKRSMIKKAWLSNGTTSLIDHKTSKEKLKNGPMYIHFSGTCLKRYNTERFYAQDEDFDYTQKCIDKRNCYGLQRKGKDIFTKFGLTVLMLHIHFLQIRHMSIFFD